MADRPLMSAFAPGISVERSMVTSAGVDWHAALAVLHVAAALLLVAVLLSWGRHERRWRVVVAATAALAAIVAAFSAALAPEDIPTDWVTVLHHGLGRKTIMHLYTLGVHAGMAFHYVLAVLFGPSPTLYDVVWLNLLLALVNALIFFVFALHVTRLAWAVVWTLVFALNPLALLVSFSELPSHVLGLYFFAGAVAWVLLHDRHPHGRAARAAAYGLCATATVLTALIRLDVAIVGATALAVEAAYAALGPEAWAALGRRLAALGERLLAALSEHPAVTVVLCLVGVWFSHAGLPWLLGRAEFAGLYPFNPSILSFYFYLPMLMLPVAVSVAVLLGSARAVVEFRRFGGLALSLFVLLRMYLSAQFQYFEMGRYLSYVLPAIWLLGVFGHAEIGRATRGWRPTWQRAALVVYLMAWFTRPVPGAPEFYLRPEYSPQGGFAQVLLERNTQREVRYLLDLTRRHPQCLFVARVLVDHGDPDRDPRYTYLAFGAPLAAPVVADESATTLEQFVEQNRGGSSCVRLYYGSDCNLSFTDRCRAFVAGRRLVEEHRFWSRPYNPPPQSGEVDAEVVLAAYGWP